MVEGGRITAILDWESAGWFPAHWEYCKAKFTSFAPLAEFWDPWIPAFIPPFEMESEVDMEMFLRLWVPRERAW
jgi:hypothetical protein